MKITTINSEGAPIFTPEMRKLFESFLNNLEDLDPVLIESVKIGYSMIFENISDYDKLST